MEQTIGSQCFELVATYDCWNPHPRSSKVHPLSAGLLLLLELSLLELCLTSGWVRSMKLRETCKKGFNRTYHIIPYHTISYHIISYVYIIFIYNDSTTKTRPKERLLCSTECVHFGVLCYGRVICGWDQHGPWPLINGGRRRSKEKEGTERYYWHG